MSLQLSARIEDKNTEHTVIGVFQNGAKSGVLCVQTQYSNEIVALLTTDKTKDKETGE